MSRYRWATVGDFDVAIDTWGGDWTLDEIRARDSEVPLNDYLTPAAIRFFYEKACDILSREDTLERVA